MKIISIAELHAHTFEYIEAARTEMVIVSHHGQPVVRLELLPARTTRTLADRTLRPGFARLVGKLGSKASCHDGARFISEERDAR